ncbi:hypothetical protein AAC387_Pa04g0841 [Persea americana]
METQSIEDEEHIRLNNIEGVKEEKPSNGIWDLLWVPLDWFRMLSDAMHWSSVFGIIVIYGVSQGMGGALGRVALGYYWKDVQMVQPSESQVYLGIINIPWIVKPLWGLLTDVFPVAGYRRRPYFILAGLVGVISMLVLALHNKLHVVFALLFITAGSAGVAISDVTIDACAAENSIARPTIAADIQSLCGFSSSIGALLGFSVSGLLVHLMGSQGVLGFLSVPAALVFLVGIVLNEPRMPKVSYGQLYRKLLDANQTMWTTLKCPDVWRPCLFMYISFALSLNIHEGMFYWYTDPKAGPAFSQEKVGFIFSVGAAGSLLGVLLYHNALKDYQFRNLLFWAQLLLGASGMLDLVLVLRLNLKLGLPDYLFIVIDGCVSHMIGRIKWLPLLVLSSKLCPKGIEGTFFALIMSIDNAGLLTSSWSGGLLLHILKITRTEFSDLWLAILIRNIMRLFPLALLFLLPKTDQNSVILPMEMLEKTEAAEIHEVSNLEMAALIENGK